MTDPQDRRPDGAPGPVEPVLPDDLIPGLIPGEEEATAAELEDDALFDELVSYLDRGEQPPQALLDRSPSNRLAFEALLRVRTMARELLDTDAAATPAADDAWVDRILGNLRREAHAGRDIPLTHPSPRAALVVTEGAVRGLIRAAGDQVPGALVGACRLVGDVTRAGADIEIQVEASVFWGESLPAIAAQLRSAISSTLLQHTELSVVAIDVIISDVHLRLGTPDEGIES